MARNEEKAQSMLNRFLQSKNEEKKKPKERRPFLASECRDLAEADRWRQQIVREIGRKVMDVQNPGLGEHRLRDLNDEINKLIREKGHWEARILELGGPNYAKTGPKVSDADGNEVEAASGKGLGYRYFGATKQLPGVKELFDRPPEIKKRRSRYEMYKRIDADYYGYRDDEDGLLEKLERDAELDIRTKALEDWQRVESVKNEARKGVQSGEVVQVKPLFEEDEEVFEDTEDDREREMSNQHREFVAHVPLPDEKEIERMVVQKKKLELLSKYTSDTLIEEEVEAKALLNIHRCHHEVEVARINGVLGDIDADIGDAHTGSSLLPIVIVENFHPEIFLTDVEEATLVMLTVIKTGGLSSGGFNFDNKLRTRSIDLEDLFLSHIVGMDAMARGLQNAAKLYEAGKADFDTMEKRAFEWGEPALTSGKLELAEVILHMSV